MFWIRVEVRDVKRRTEDIQEQKMARLVSNELQLLSADILQVLD